MGPEGQRKITAENWTAMRGVGQHEDRPGKRDVVL